jgi:hypothetical protein
MISRQSTKLLANVYGGLFRTKTKLRAYERVWVIDEKDLYDFFYENGYETWFLNLVERAALERPRSLVEFIMKIHTGETLVPATPKWTQEQREKLGQRYLKDIAEDIIEYHEKERLTVHADEIGELKSRLELDGYIWNAGSKKLLFSEAAVLDVKEEQGILMTLAAELSVDKQDTIFHHLTLSEEHYVAGKWDDSISNSRKVLEAVLQECAAKISISITGKILSKEKYDSPAEVRDYLESEGILESKEKKAIASTYSLLSDTGGHPYIAEKDQARLMRHLALTYSQFVMLRLKGYLAQLKS